MRQSFEEWLRDKKIKDAPTLEFVSWLSHKRISDIIEYAEQWSSQQTDDAVEILGRIIKSTPHSMCLDAEAWAKAEQILDRKGNKDGERGA